MNPQSEQTFFCTGLVRLDLLLHKKLFTCRMFVTRHDGIRGEQNMTRTDRLELCLSKTNWHMPDTHCATGYHINTMGEDNADDNKNNNNDNDDDDDINYNNSHVRV